MSQEVFKRTQVTMWWLLANGGTFGLGVAATCYHYQPAANLVRFIVVLSLVFSISFVIGRKNPGQRFRSRNLKLPPRWLDQGVDIVIAILFVSHGWFVIASCWILHIFMLEIVRTFQARPVTAIERGKAMITYYWANSADTPKAEVLPYLLADLQLSEGEAFMPALNKAYSYAATEEENCE